MNRIAPTGPLCRILAFTLAISLVVSLAACRRGSATGTGDRIDPSKIPTQTLPSTLPDPIIVSGPGGRGTPTPAAATDVYTVSPGDTLAAIAARYNTTVEELARSNGITDISRLEVGQRLNVPRPATPTPSASRTPTPAGSATVRSGSVTPTTPAVPGAIRTATPSATAGAIRTPTIGAGSAQIYEVKPGDTASAIASTFGITVQDLAAANDMTVPDLANLRVGQTLRIPRR